MKILSYFCGLLRHFNKRLKLVWYLKAYKITFFKLSILHHWNQMLSVKFIHWKELSPLSSLQFSSAAATQENKSEIWFLWKKRAPRERKLTEAQHKEGPISICIKSDLGVWISVRGFRNCAYVCSESTKV